MANRLQNEDSPYLKQHSLDPINWYPWGEEALNRAKEENKPIFISIGYSSCHWCHIMQKESFSNSEIATLLNEHFISIKVDKEERPDIDRHFQEIFIKMNNKAGGWPLSIFTTPNLIPIYSAAYLPIEPKFGIIGFKELLNTITQSYKRDPQLLINKGEEVLNALKPKNKIEATKIDENLINIAIKQIKQVYEPEFGGFGKAPKYPHTYTLNLTIDLYKLTKDSELKEIVNNTLKNMLLGGIYDIVDGGIYRYSTNEQWLVPYFGKSCYDNALFIETLLKAYDITKDSLYLDKAYEVADFMIEKLSQKGLFFSACDGNRNSVEGEYFLFDYNETKDAFKEKGLDLDLLDKLSITKNGNFNGKSIARLKDIRLYNDLQIKEALKVLKEVRSKKVYPFVDKKIITSLNGMMINALCKLSRYDSRYLDIAKISLEALLNKMVDGVKLYHSSLIDSPRRVEGFLEDYVWLIKAYLAYYEVSLDKTYLVKATNLANEAIRLFYKGGRWIIGNLDFKNFADFTDVSFPSSVAIMTQNMLTLRSLVDSIYEKFAFNSLQVSSYKLMRQPISMPTMTSAALKYLNPDYAI